MALFSLGEIGEILELYVNTKGLILFRFGCHYLLSEVIEASSCEG